MKGILLLPKPPSSLLALSLACCLECSPLFCKKALVHCSISALTLLLPFWCGVPLGASPFLSPDRQSPLYLPLYSRQGHAGFTVIISPLHSAWHIVGKKECQKSGERPKSSWTHFSGAMWNTGQGQRRWEKGSLGVQSPGAQLHPRAPPCCPWEARERTDPWV